MGNTGKQGKQEENEQNKNAIQYALDTTTSQQTQGQSKYMTTFDNCALPYIFGVAFWKCF
jgi:hypothetical protein